MENVSIKKTEYVAVPRENILQWLLDEKVLKPIGNGDYEVIGDNGKPAVRIYKNRLKKWAYFPIKDECLDQQDRADIPF